MEFQYEDLKKDIFIEEKVVKVNIDNYNSVHKVSKYRVRSGAFIGKTYFVFDFMEGKSIMNYLQEDYQLLYNQVKIDYDEPIFQMSSTLNNYNLIEIPSNYRSK